MSSADSSLLGYPAPFRSRPADVRHQPHVPPAPDRGPTARREPDDAVRCANRASIIPASREQEL
jgi:hypothetical protein